MTDPRPSVSPCRFPGCRDHNGDPVLTVDLFCSACRARYRTLLDRVVLDWVTLRSTLPTPARREGDGSKHTSQRSKSFGHPAEWASDTAREIADALNEAEDYLREALGHAPPPRHPGFRERNRVGHAYRYLTAQFDRLISNDDRAAVDTAVQLGDLHGKVRSVLGLSLRRQTLPTPCPWCDVAALVRSVGSISCTECGKVIEEQHYDWLAGWIVDRMIDDYDTRRATEGA